LTWEIKIGVCRFPLKSGDVLVRFSHDKDIEEGQSLGLFKLHSEAKIGMPLVDSLEELMDFVNVDFKDAEHIIDVS
jgi:hypothetical protein